MEKRLKTGEARLLAAAMLVALEAEEPVDRHGTRT